MNDKLRKSLSQYAAEAASEVTVDGSGPACPKCGCRDLLADKTIQQTSRTIRYRRCRHCGHKVLTRQETPAPTPETIIRDVTPYGEDSSLESPRLTLVRDSA